MKTLSIITINKNNAVGLKKTIHSVVCQTNIDFEYLIIDGASDDESVEIIKKYSNSITYWISEPDTGIYNAMNKGIRKAQGNYCLFLNSGDWLVSPETLSNVFREIKNNHSDIFYSDRKNSNNKIIRYPEFLTIDYLARRPINHQNSLIKRSLFFEHGFYNENLKIASDWEFFLKELWEYKSTFFHLKTNISVFDTSGISSRSQISERYNEYAIIFKNVFQELAAPLLEYRYIRRTIYYRIFTKYSIFLKRGEPNFLKFLLTVYKIFLKMTSYIFSSSRKGNV